MTIDTIPTKTNVHSGQGQDDECTLTIVIRVLPTCTDPTLQPSLSAVSAYVLCSIACQIGTSSLCIWSLIGWYYQHGNMFVCAILMHERGGCLAYQV